jgi:hypothetical protein
MKLMTEMVKTDSGNFVPYVSLEVRANHPHPMSHDMAAAHALMWAMREMANIPPCCDPYEVPAMITERADELMAEWGFDREKVES